MPDAVKLNLFNPVNETDHLADFSDVKGFRINIQRFTDPAEINGEDIGKKALHLTEICIILSRKYPSAYLYNQYKAIHNIE